MDDDMMLFFAGRIAALEALCAGIIAQLDAASIGNPTLGIRVRNAASELPKQQSEVDALFAAFFPDLRQQGFVPDKFYEGATASMNEIVKHLAIVERRLSTRR